MAAIVDFGWCPVIPAQTRCFGCGAMKHAVSGQTGGRMFWFASCALSVQGMRNNILGTLMPGYVAQTPVQAWLKCLTACSVFRRGDDAVGNPHRAQVVQFELFELVLLLKLEKQFPVEQFEAIVSQSAVPSPTLSFAFASCCVSPFAVSTSSLPD